MPDKANWIQLEKDLCIWLSEFSSKGIVYKNSNQAIVGFPSDGLRSDGMLTNGETLIAIEVEAGQTHPDTNTGKYWLLYNEYKSYKKIVLFHIYTPKFDSYGWRKRLAEFYVERMQHEVPIEYKLMDFRCSDDYNKVLLELKKKIKRKIEKEFGLTKAP